VEESMSLSNPVWNRRIIRTIGTASIFFALFGGFFAVTSAPRSLAGLRDSPAHPYVREAYCVMAFVDLCCLVTLTVGGVYLLRLRRAGLIISNVGFAIEIGWFLGSGLLLPLIWFVSGGRARALTDSIAGATGIGSIGTTPQIITGYPVIALIFLNLARGAFRNEGPRT
jgi:hypothetical protein